MAKKQKERSELEHIRAENRNLRSENRNLKKKLKRLEKREHHFEKTEDFEDEIEETTIIDKCPSCGKGTLEDMHIPNNKVIQTCNMCDFRSKPIKL